MNQLNAKVRSIVVKGVPFTLTAHPESNFIFGKGVQFEWKGNGLFTPVYQTMELNAEWFRQIPANAQGIYSPHTGRVFVNRLGDPDAWKISSYGPSFYVDIVEGDRLKVTGTSEQINAIFGQVIYNN